MIRKERICKCGSIFLPEANAQKLCNPCRVVKKMKASESKIKTRKRRKKNEVDMDKPIEGIEIINSITAEQIKKSQSAPYKKVRNINI